MKKLLTILLALALCAGCALAGGVTAREAMDIAAARLGDAADVFCVFKVDCALERDLDDDCYRVTFTSAHGEHGRDSFTVRVSPDDGEVLSAPPEGALQFGREALDFAMARYAEQMTAWRAAYGEYEAFWTSEQRAEHTRYLTENFNYDDPLGGVTLALSSARNIADEAFARAAGEEALLSGRVQVDAQLARKDGNSAVARWIFQYNYQMPDAVYGIGAIEVASPEGWLVSNNITKESYASIVRAADVDARRDALFAENGPWWMWSMEDVLANVEVFSEHYTYPGEDDIPEEQAIATARAEAKRLGPDSDVADDLLATARFYVETELAHEPRIWLVALYGDVLDERYDNNAVYQIRVDATTGEIIDFFEPGGNG